MLLEIMSGLTAEKYGDSLGSLGGSSVTKPSSYEVGELIITDNAYYYNGKTYYGIKFQGGSGRFGWVEESIIHQRTN